MTVEQLRSLGSPALMDYLIEHQRDWVRVGSSHFSQHYSDIDLLVPIQKLPTEFNEEVDNLWHLTAEVHHKGEDRNYIDPLIILNAIAEYSDVCELFNIGLKSDGPTKLQFILLNTKKFLAYCKAHDASLDFFKNCSPEHKALMSNSKDFRVGFFQAYKHQQGL